MHKTQRSSCSETRECDAARRKLWWFQGAIQNTPNGPVCACVCLAVRQHHLWTNNQPVGFRKRLLQIIISNQCLFDCVHVSFRYPQYSRVYVSVSDNPNSTGIQNAFVNFESFTTEIKHPDCSECQASSYVIGRLVSLPITNKWQCTGRYMERPTVKVSNVRWQKNI